MTDKESRAQDYLTHIVESIERVESYTADLDENRFLDDELVQDAVIRNLEVIGEASNNLLKNCPSTVSQFPDIPLTSAYQMRNAIAHGYFKIDYELVWRTIEKDLPPLHEQVLSAIKSIEK
ncbi:HepT-like ribonuclease domain-containing protein [Idiomarina aminovorans]|uniref:HepT-like ribonuclease domain-containing protein n=1 Tax=Idiomarina aminovorans TaxID=2914829 RepID=UPI0020051B0F|nr:DUF86 domain-containing protein [Idiomarina sp. ATCH4]MCK7458058.1 DUF86 domain-containing protein [Idiomarina sp. ATCH4]